ncbi:MAG: glycosyltransferase [Bryobacteraceae bacterium]
MHFGIITPPVPGHLHPFGALGRELIRRGHRATVFHMPDLGPRVPAEGLEFAPIGAAICPPGFLAHSLAAIGQLHGLRALRFTISQIRATTEMFFGCAPEAIRAAGIDALLVDQTEPAGGSIAAHLGIPFVTVCNALALNCEPGVPPPFTPWNFRTGIAAHLRNRFGYAAADWVMGPVRRTVARYRKEWKLPPLVSADDSFSKIAQISQQPPAFDFPRRALPPSFHYVGPLRSPGPQPIPFPWERLDGRPLIYASLGTLQTGKRWIFQCFAKACLGLDVQLVIAHGGALEETAASSLPGHPIATAYAPQRDLLARASLTLSHAGLNTVLDSLSFGVPVVAVPITFEQPAIASRLAWCRAGCVLPLARLTPDRLRGAITRVLGNAEYRECATAAKKSIEQAGGVERAADLLEQVLR